MNKNIKKIIIGFIAIDLMVIGVATLLHKDRANKGIVNNVTAKQITCKVAYNCYHNLNYSNINDNVLTNNPLTQTSLNLYKQYKDCLGDKRAEIKQNAVNTATMDVAKQQVRFLHSKTIRQNILEDVNFNIYYTNHEKVEKFCNENYNI